MENKDRLILALVDHMHLLGEELNSVCGMAILHGWQSGNIEKGKETRRKIVDLCVEVYGEDKGWVYTGDLKCKQCNN